MLGAAVFTSCGFTLQKHLVDFQEMGQMWEKEAWAGRVSSVQDSTHLHLHKERPVESARVSIAPIRQSSRGAGSDKLVLLPLRKAYKGLWLSVRAGLS